MTTPSRFRPTTAVAAVVAAVAVAALAACQPTAHDSAPRTVGTLLIDWSEADHDRGFLEQLADPHLVRSPDELDALVAMLDPAMDPDGVVAGVDLDQHLLVVGGYPRCSEHSRVEAGAGDDTLTFVVEGDDDIICVWAPLQIDVWQVDRTGLAEDVALEPRD